MGSKTHPFNLQWNILQRNQVVVYFLPPEMMW